MSSPLVIRDLAAPDLDSLLSLYTHLHEIDDPLPQRAEVEKVWARILADDDLIYMGGFAGDVLVSACNAAVIPNLTRGARPYALIENVVTHAGHRRRGVGAAVIRSVIERCWARRCYKIALTSGVSRADFYGFYESLGFDRHAKQAFVISAR